MAIENLMSAPSAGLAELYDGFRQEHLVALWTEIGDLMPASPQSDAPILEQLHQYRTETT
jgi:gentisate 1,2-dioxygenase